MAETSVFGNIIRKRDLGGTEIEYAMCHLLFGTDEKPVELAAVKRGEVYRDFGVRTLVAKNSVTEEEKFPIEPGRSIILGTMRMGFGHWRMTIAMASAAKYLGYTPYILDIKSFEGTVATKSINFLEYWYNVGSRLSQKWKWFNKHIWELTTSAGGICITSCVRERNLSRLFTPLMLSLPKDIPMTSAHPWVGHTAVLAGMKNVVSIIPDNYPLAYWLVEGTKHCVQSPSAFMGYRTLLHMEPKHSTISKCVPKEQIMCSGHYVDHEIVSNIENDCGRRLARLASKEARRFLLTMGGAGAQAERFADICRTCKNYIEDNKAVFFINMGDHEGRWNVLKKYLEEDGISYTMHDDWEQTKEFVKQSEAGSVSGVHIFLHRDFYAAVYATNILMRISDVMITKPSELSFYPVPKLFIQRVGRHEAWGAIRGSEIGDGTVETDTVDGLHRTLRTLIEEDDLMRLYCRRIIENYHEGIYDGAYTAIKTATAGIQQ